MHIPDRLLFIFFALAMIGGGVRAQPASDVNPSALDGFYERLDSLMDQVHYKPSPEELDSNILNIYGFKPDEVPVYEASVISQRLKDLGTVIPLEHNPYVEAYIKVYTVERRDQVRRMLGLQHVFFPIFEEVLDREKLPMELKYLAVVESALNPHAVSRAGATGLWQFMFTTGKQYGLNVTSHVDERRDPVKATEAAVEYFKNMYRIYHDWLLVIAAYNCGPGNVNKALKLGNGKTSFWDIREFLPRETRGYVPAFVAAVYAFNYHREHNLYPIPVEFTYQQDTIQIVRQKVTLQQIADLTNCSFYELCDLNPELKSTTIPYSPVKFCVRVPYKAAEFFTLNRDSAYSYIRTTDPDSILRRYKDSVLVSMITRKPYINTPGGYATPPDESGLVYHTVRSGEVVSRIAEKYGVTNDQVAVWNNLINYRISGGQKLKIYVKPAATASAKTSPAPSVPASPAEQTTTVDLRPDPQKFIYHTVKPGDTLWDIANLYPGASVEKLKSMNNLPNARLKIGQNLRVL